MLLLLSLFFLQNVEISYVISYFNLMIDLLFSCYHHFLQFSLRIRYLRHVYIYVYGYTSCYKTLSGSDIIAAFNVAASPFACSIQYILHLY